MIRCLSLVSLMLCANPAQASSPRAERPKLSKESSPQLGRLALQTRTTIKIDRSLRSSPTMGEPPSKKQGVTWSTLTPNRKKTLIGAGAMAVVFSGTSIAFLLTADGEEEKNMALVLAGIFTAVPVLVTTIKWFAEP